MNDKIKILNSFSSINAFMDANERNPESLVLVGFPTDIGCCFRTGARFGPSAIRELSWNLESFSPYCRRELTDLNFCDIGDAVFKNKSALDRFWIIAEIINNILERNNKIVSLGGDHSITPAIISSFAKKYPQLILLHFDAHADLRLEFEGNTFSNACAMGNSLKYLDKNEKSFFQFGIRSMSKEEFIQADQLASVQSNAIKTLTDILKSSPQRPVYVSFDLDVFDPANCPGTGTPEAGGWSFLDFLDILPMLSKLNIVGADIVELAPNLDLSNASSALAAKVTREIMLHLFSDKP